LCSGIDLERWQERLAADGEDASLDEFTERMKSNYIPNTVMIDCTASAKVASYYEKWIRQGMHIITPNKRANSGPLDYVSGRPCAFGGVIAVRTFVTWLGRLVET
jgi:aspartokinase/homoserine dehydrogenase 1